MSDAQSAIVFMYVSIGCTLGMAMFVRDGIAKALSMFVFWPLIILLIASYHVGSIVMDFTRRSES